MAYVNLIQRSGLGQWTMLKRLRTAVTTAVPLVTAAPVTMPARPTVVAALPYALRVAREEAAREEAATRAAIVARTEARARASAAQRGEIVARTEAAEAEAWAEAIRARQIPSPVLMPARPPIVGRPVVPTMIRGEGPGFEYRPPFTFRPTGIAPALTLQIRAPGGAYYETTQVEVQPGPDIHAPTTGQSISLRETDPIIPLTATREGIRITDETEPTFVEAAAIEPSPWMKYALLAVGGYILYDSFVKSKPKRKTRRRRR